MFRPGRVVPSYPEGFPDEEGPGFFRSHLEDAFRKEGVDPEKAIVVPIFEGDSGVISKTIVLVLRPGTLQVVGVCKLTWGY